MMFMMVVLMGRTNLVLFYLLYTGLHMLIGLIDIRLQSFEGVFLLPGIITAHLITHINSINK
jgi:hypothetical protein